MNFFSTLLVLAQGIAFAHAAGCNADNCARAVTGLQRGSAAYATAQADCASFFQATVTPCTSISTVYAYIFPSIVVSTVVASTETDVATVYPFTETDVTTVATILVRTIVPPCSMSTYLASNIPKYASACSGTVRYSSACSCFGATRTTVTLATPTALTTVTITGTATSIVSVTTSTTLTLSETTTIISSVTTTSKTSASAPTATDCNQLGGSYTSKNGKKFNTNCSQWATVYNQLITSNPVANYVECLELCSTTPGCNVVDYTAVTDYCYTLRNAANGYQSAGSSYMSGALIGG